MAAYTIMGHLMVQDASKNAELFGTSAQVLLEIIIWTFKVSRIRFQYPAKAKIVLTKDCLSKVNLYDIKRQHE